MGKKLIVVMGVQRSGTNALFYSLAADTRLAAYNEKDGDEFYDNFFLRPEPEIRHLLLELSGTVLLKPISETYRRSVRAVLDEYARYDVHLVWIYRDPVNVVFSAHQMGWYNHEQLTAQSALWTRRNQSLLDCLPDYSARVSLVRYDDLITDRTIFIELCRQLDVAGQDILRADSNAGRTELPQQWQKQIDDATRPTLTALDKARTYKSGWPHRLGRSWQQWFRSKRPQSVPQPDTLYPPALGAQGADFYLTTRQLASDRPGQSLRTWRDLGPSALQPEIQTCAPIYRPIAETGGLSVSFKEENGIAPGLRYHNEKNWAFLYNGSPFTIFLICRLAALPPDRGAPALATVLQIGAPEKSGPAFRLTWDYTLQTWSGSILSGQSDPSTGRVTCLSVVSARQIADESRWAAVVCRHTPYGAGRNLALAVNLGYPTAGFKDPAFDYASNPAVDDVLQIGGVDEAGTPYFTGELTELAIFRQAVDDTRRDSISRYLAAPYFSTDRADTLR